MASSPLKVFPLGPPEEEETDLGAAAVMPKLKDDEVIACTIAVKNLRFGKNMIIYSSVMDPSFDKVMKKVHETAKKHDDPGVTYISEEKGTNAFIILEDKEKAAERKKEEENRKEQEILKEQEEEKIKEQEEEKVKEQEEEKGKEQEEEKSKEQEEEKGKEQEEEKVKEQEEEKGKEQEEEEEKRKRKLKKASTFGSMEDFTQPFKPEWYARLELEECEETQKKRYKLDMMALHAEILAEFSKKRSSDRMKNAFPFPRKEEEEE